MCKAWEDAQEEAAVLATIETLREVDFSEKEIERKIMVKYNLTEEQARDYMLKKQPNL